MHWEMSWKNSSFNKIIAASCCRLVFFLRCWLRVILPKKTRSKFWSAWLGTAFGVLTLLLFAESVLAAPCDLRSSPPPFIRHDLSASYCELCGYGYVTVIVSNPYEEVDMTAMTVVENLGTSGLTFDPSAPNPVTYRVNGGSSQVGLAPTISGANGSTLTWTSAQIPALSRLAYDPLPLFPPYTTITDITITFAVMRAGVLTQEGLVSADRRIQASLTYDTDGAVDCFPGSTTISTGLDTLTLREPNPVVTKSGRNVDASQGNWTSTVYGNVDDDVIWRIQVSNATGTADLQDLRFDDLMQDGSLDINYACPTLTAATAVTGNNGVAPGGSVCVVAGNTISDFDVDNPFGNPDSDSPDIVDVPQGGSAYIYLVGKIRSAPDGSCTNNRTNTVSDIQWGCEDDSPPAGGISQTSDGDNPGSDSTTLYTRYGERANLSVERRLTGTNTSQPVGSKGTMTIIIRNYTGGSVKNITMTDVLPSEYVMDPTFTPTVTMDPRYGTYDGMIDNITWDNQDTNPLNNTVPEFTLTSSGCSIGPCEDTVHPFYPDQQDMMRDGDELTIVFRVVLIEPPYYDKVANLDVREEDDPDGTDPDNQTTLTNSLTVEFDTFCAAQGHQTLLLTGNGTATNGSAIPAFPEDIDIDIAGSELVFILTGDPAQRLPLTVELTNNGGHDAADYIAYVSFGQTMDVVTVPSGCSLTGNPPAHDEWQVPATIPATAAIYACTGSAIAPGQTVSRTFEVVKSTDAADLAADDLTFRADVVGEIRLSDTTLLTFPTPINPRADGGIDLGNNYSLDGIRARVIGFNLLKSQVGNCTENNPPPSSPDLQVQIGEECTYHIDTGGWFGFQTPGYSLIAVQDIQVFDQLPDGQGYISSTDPYLTSTGAIQSISLNPAGLAAPNEVTAPDYMNWTFNWGDALRITEKDHWFRADMTSRLLNDPVDTSAAPNQHADLSTNVLVSNFRALFQNDVTGMLESYLLGPGTVGYPRLAVRSFSLTVTEPHITVVKEVCNESLYGNGPTCSNFVPLADDGDAYNSYIYRITLTNEASSGGVDRAPAYDVTVTDTLDASDLAYVLPFNSDSLDNDADSATDEAGANSEGTISDNTVRNGTPAQLTFSYTHSTALARINPGQSVQLYYRVDYDDDAAPLQTFTNTAGATYDSLTGDSGNQSVPQCDNSEACGARFYISDTASSSVRIIPVETQPKEIANLSNTPLAVAGTQEAVVGEEIEYRLTTSLPVALLRNFVIRDELPAGLRCSEAPAG